jgi:putative tricarboxylic transport membrane protein
MGVLRGRLTDSADRIAGVVIALFGVWFLWQAAILREGPGYAAVGPRVFPIIVGFGILASGVALAIFPPPETEAEAEVEARPDWRTLAGAMAILAGYVVLFQPLGFVVASTAFIGASSWNLGSTHWRRDLAAGLATSVAAYLVFTSFLGLELPAGPLP